MKFKGFNFTKANNLLSRLSKEGDTYPNGEAVPKGHYVVVRPKDCEVVRVEGNTIVYNTDDAPCIHDMTGHSLTNMFYGKWKKRKSEMGVWVENLDQATRLPEIAHEYWQCTVYLVKNRRVYKASIKRAMSPRQEQIVAND